MRPKALNVCLATPIFGTRFLCISYDHIWYIYLSQFITSSLSLIQWVIFSTEVHWGLRFNLRFGLGRTHTAGASGRFIFWDDWKEERKLGVNMYACLYWASRSLWLLGDDSPWNWKTPSPPHGRKWSVWDRLPGSCDVFSSVGRISNLFTSGLLCSASILRGEPML